MHTDLLTHQLCFSLPTLTLQWRSQSFENSTFFNPLSSCLRIFLSSSQQIVLTFCPPCLKQKNAPLRADEQGEVSS